MKRILLTGGSRGLGLAISRALAADGCSVHTVSRRSSPELSQMQKDFPGLVRSRFADLARIEETQKLCDELRTGESFHGFVANAAIGIEGLLTLTSPEAITQCIQVNLSSVILLTREVIKGMLEHGGSVVFISSVSAIRGYSGLSVYSATKGALLAFSRSLAREYGPRGIRFNCVLPGFLATDMTESLSPENKERIRRRSALQRTGTPLEVISTVRLLLSDEGGFITGAEFVVDGGLSA